MRTGAPIVSKRALQSTTQRSLIPHDHVVQTLASDGAHESLRKRILPGGSRRGEHFLHSHNPGHVGKVSSVDGVSIAQHVSRRLVPGKRFPRLLHRPVLRGVFRHPEVQYLVRSWESTTKTNRTRKVAVGTVKKSMAAVCAR